MELNRKSANTSRPPGMCPTIRLFCKRKHSNRPCVQRIVRAKNRRGNQELTIQRHRQHWVQYIERRAKKKTKNTKQKR